MRHYHILTNLLIVTLWLFGIDIPAAWAKAEQNNCKLTYFQGLTKDLKRFDNSDLSKYQNVAAKLEHCLNESTPDLYLFKNEIFYKMGLIHLSLGNDMKAMNAFEELKNLGDSYYNVSKERLSDLYTSFGLWARLKNLLPEDDTSEFFKSLNKTLYEKIYDENKFSTIDDELVPMLNISPYDIDILTIRSDFLFRKLIDSSHFNDLTVAYEITRVYETILEKHKIMLSLDKRIQIHYSIAMIQLLILNIEPTQHIRKCLSIDMDYKPCKDLSLMVSRLNKINPTRSQLFDTQTYTSEKNIDWEEINKYYTVDKRKNQINYDWINNHIVESINRNIDLFITHRPITKKLFLKKDTKTELVSTADNFAFFKFIDIILCQANMELSLKSKNKKEHKKLMDHYCKKIMKETFSKEDLDKFVNTLNKKDAQLPEEFINTVWNTYPTVAIYMVDKIISRKNFRLHNGQLQDVIIKFFDDNSLFNTMDPFIQKEASIIQKIMNQKQKLNEQRQQQQQRQFFQQFAGGQQGQQRGPPPQQPPAHNPDKDYYKILSVPKDANSKEIRKAYLNLTKKYHPDKQGNMSEDEQKKVHEKMSEINEAYEILSDDSKRNEYDNMSRGGGPGAGASFGNQRQQGNRNGWFNFQQQAQGNPFPFGNMRGGF
ncbi:hypothetical protein C6P45_002327 [Maudiozyma exigua]|uniref:J domain-containing protein n=1 Tax=Maudiozyma exigua TaxID=34358 RepID=A0A9P7B3V0_MAUEX|nr:hypothetical protein C6P45_002327 [Kazachstania exigua]